MKAPTLLVRLMSRNIRLRAATCSLRRCPLALFAAFVHSAFALSALPAHAQATVGARFTGLYTTETGLRIPLPPGTWELKALKTEEQPKDVTRHIVFEHENATRVDFPFVVLRYAVKNYADRWADICGSQDGSFWRSRHGTQPSQLLQKCERIWMDRLPAEGQPTRSKWAWSGLYSAFDVHSRLLFLPNQLFVRSNIAIAMDRGDWVMLEVFANPSLAGLTASAIRDSIVRGQPNLWAKEFMDWSASYVEALKLSVIDKRYTGAPPFNPAGSAASVASTSATEAAPRLTQPTDQQVNADLQSAIRTQAAATARANEEEARRREQAALEQQRLEAARRLEAAEEARRKEAQDKQQATQQARAEQAERERLQAEVQRLRAELEQQRQPPAMATQANRKALVIGNDSYRHTRRLATAREDAKAMADGLRRAGFTVTVRLDVAEKDMRSTLRQFASQVQGGDEVVFFYAGHGVQLGGINYLIPIDTNGENEAQLRDDAIPLQRILDDMTDRKAKLTVAVIDACRDNPFQVAGRSLGGATRGLAATTAATGQMIIFSAGSGQRALDNLGPNDKSPNGVFTRVFVQEMTKRGVSIDRMVRNARSEVVRLAQSIGHDQVPAIYDQVIGEFFLIK